jgi:hypothetical protein
LQVLALLQERRPYLSSYVGLAFVTLKTSLTSLALPSFKAHPFDTPLPKARRSAVAGIVYRYDLPKNQFIFSLPRGLGVGTGVALHQNPDTPLSMPWFPPRPSVAGVPSLLSPLHEPHQEFSFFSFPFPLIVFRFVSRGFSTRRKDHATDIATSRILRRFPNFHSLRAREQRRRATQPVLGTAKRHSHSTRLQRQACTNRFPPQMHPRCPFSRL